MRNSVTPDSKRLGGFGCELTKETKEALVNRAPVPSDQTYNPGPPIDKSPSYAVSGFWITGRDYQLRPKAIESWYYAYRATGSTMYQDWAWDAFMSINATCFTGVGFSAISDVNVVNGSSFLDSQDSFVFAVVSKYSYLIHAEKKTMAGLRNDDTQFVYSTEGHPFKVAGKPT
ncbi:putative Glycoside hydrolase family 47 protein [Seiridium cardinale]|uniref:alpha-1,2-Mannosidase n=1 Tax=Seiridium cardinale TaxID=138064 RepID=A0ABR2X6T7_9PEZI